MVWLEIFAGGIGGLIARFRPNCEPDPKTMQAYLLNYLLTQHSAPEIKATADYTATNAEGEVLVATDADVAVITENAIRMVLDILMEYEPSGFPGSIYLIGLSRGWIFKEPFHTIPIDLSNVESSITMPELSDQAAVDTLNFLGKLISKANT